MKKLAILILLLSPLISSIPSKVEIAQSRGPASDSKVFTCKYRSGDIGTVVGQGTNPTEAFKDAAEKCFDRRVASYEALRGPIDEERGMMMIDSCANISCSK